MEISSGGAVAHSKPPKSTMTWDHFKSSVRKADRTALLVEAASTTARMSREGSDPTESRQGMTPWAVADVARTSLAWGQRRHDAWGPDTLKILCNKNLQLTNQGMEADRAEGLGVARTLRRTFFEQFPGQRSAHPEIARTLLLFGDVAEHPENLRPKIMTPGWFERLMGGHALSDYIGAVLMISSLAQHNHGVFAPQLLDVANQLSLEHVVPADVLSYVFENQLVTTLDQFKIDNAEAQGSRPDPQKKFAFNPLTVRPFVRGVTPYPIAPWIHAIDQRAYPPAIYFLATKQHGQSFGNDFGYVFQHYIGRQLSVVDDARRLMPEVRIGGKSNSLDTCDWFLDLPGVLVLIECKARQPDEALKLTGFDRESKVSKSIGKGIHQLNKSHARIAEVAALDPRIDATKPRVGLVVTLEPFYFNQGWELRDGLEPAQFPVGVLSADELEQITLLDAAKLSVLLLDASSASEDNILVLDNCLEAADGRANPLLKATWESMQIFDRIDKAENRDV